PSPSASQDEVVEWLKAHRVCFHHAFGRECFNSISRRCRYTHDDSVVPKGYFANLSQDKPSTTPANNSHTMVALTDAHLHYLAAMQDFELPSPFASSSTDSEVPESP
ncbi:unnamed protein product, partial [Choristocarpus tenellus]